MDAVTQALPSHKTPFFRTYFLPHKLQKKIYLGIGTEKTYKNKIQARLEENALKTYKLIKPSKVREHLKCSQA